MGQAGGRRLPIAPSAIYKLHTSVTQSMHLFLGCGTAQHRFRSGLHKSETHRCGVSWKVSAAADMVLLLKRGLYLLLRVSQSAFAT